MKLLFSALTAVVFTILVMGSAIGAFGQGALAPDIYPVFTNVNGVTPVALGFVCTTTSGTNNPLATFQNAALSVPNLNPLTLNASGRNVNGTTLEPIFLQASVYRFTLYAAGTGNTCNGLPVGPLIWQLDGIDDVGQLLLSGNNTFTGTNTFTGAVTTTTLNNREFCTTGANFGAKFTAAAALLPATGGIVDCSNLQGAQAISVSDPFTAVTKPIILIWPSGMVSGSISLSQPSTMVWDMGEGGILSMAVATVATIRGEIKGTLSQHLAGLGSFIFPTNHIPYLYPEWWGAAHDGVTIDTVPVQSAVTASMTYGIAVYLTADTNGVSYAVDASITAVGRGLMIDGGGDAARILNVASAGKPTLDLSACQFCDLKNFAVIGRSANPNQGIFIGPGSAFIEISNLFLTPNGTCIQLTSTSTIGITDVKCWPSSDSNGGSGSGTNRKYAINADGTGSVNNVHILRLNAVGYDTIANGGAGIRWNYASVGASQNITIENSELEGTNGTTFRCIDLTGVSDVMLNGNFLENCNVRLLDSRYATMSNHGSGGATGTTYNIGDGTAANGVSNVTVSNSGASVFTATGSENTIDVVNSIFDTAPGYTNNATCATSINVRTTGSALVQDQLGCTGIKERNRTVAMGEWITPAYNAGNFTPDSGTWVVDSGDVATFEYMLIGKTMTLNFALGATTITGTPSLLKMTIPGGFTAAKGFSVSCKTSNNGAAASMISECFIIGTLSWVGIYRVADGTANWAAGTNNNSMTGSITFEVQ